MSSSPARCNIILADVEATRALGTALAKHVAKGDAVLLHGELGAGKTALAKYMIQALTGDEGSSPTFSLVQPYKAKEFTLYHYDLYRLKSAQELSELGLEEALTEGVVVMEWPEIAVAYWPAERLEITLAADHASGARNVSLVGFGSRWRAFLGGLGSGF